MTDEKPGIHGLVRIELSVYDRERGWLRTRSSVIRGGHHGPFTDVEAPPEELLPTLEQELRTMVRALQHHWSKR